MTSRGPVPPQLFFEDEDGATVCLRRSNGRMIAMERVGPCFFSICQSLLLLFFFRGWDRETRDNMSTLRQREQVSL